MDKRIKKARGDYDIETLIAKLRWPSGGLTQLQECVRVSSDTLLKWVSLIAIYCKVSRLIRFLQVSFLTTGDASFMQEMYQKFVANMLAALYTFATQGRPRAIELLQMKDFNKYWESGTMPFSRNSRQWLTLTIR